MKNSSKNRTLFFYGKFKTKMESVIMKKYTPLFNWHKQNKATFAIFGGYEMPLWYGSAKEEHLSVLTSCGIFDTSHMAGIIVKGPDSKRLLNHCFSRDLDKCIKNGPLLESYLVYGVFLSENAHVIDDSIVYKIHDQLFFVVVNASMGGTISDHLKKNQEGFEVEIEDLTDKLGKIDIQGPNSPKILYSSLKEPDKIFSLFPYFTFKGFFEPLDQDLGSNVGTVQLINGKNILLSRSGYTGEIGFEIYCKMEDTQEIWDLLFEKGKDFNITPCGLAARDSLRAGAKLPLSHQDIGNWPFLNNPWDFCLPWKEYKKSFTKDFIGKRALQELLNSYSEYTYPFVGKDLRKVNIEDHPRVITEHGEDIGEVLTCCTDMGISLVDGKVVSIASENKPKDFKPRGLCCGFVKVDKQLPLGTWVYLQDKKRKLPVKIVDDIRPDRTARKNIKNFL